MMRQPTFQQRASSALAALLAALALASCGGGDGVVGSGGTGSPLGMAIGTVNGFGSVIVDTLHYDDRGAVVLEEVAPGRDDPSEVRLGHRVSVEYETAGVARVVRVEAAAVGSVASVESATRFSILGQTVTVNGDGAAGPITQFGGGYGQASDLRAGDAVAVHGVLLRHDEATLIQATRIDRLATAPAYLRVTGIVSQLGTAGTTGFALGALTIDTTDASVVPAGAALANGQTVSVLALPGTLAAQGAGGWRVKAAQVRIRELRGGGLDDVVSGSVARLDPQAKTLVLGGLLVDYAGATLAPAATPLANGQYLLARGTVGADGVLRASSLTIRNAGSDTEGELRGNVSGYDPATGRFSVRDVSVDASGARPEGCPAGGLANGLFVEVEGALGSNGVIARTLHCEDEPSGAEIEREGLAGAVDIAATSFLLATEHGGLVAVRWTSATYFGGVTPQTLSGRPVHVQGVLDAGVLVASKVKLDD